MIITSLMNSEHLFKKKTVDILKKSLKNLKANVNVLFTESFIGWRQRDNLLPAL